jgi:enterochelin esterase-like enzyme
VLTNGGPSKENGVPAWIDYWGFDSAHDWAWWRKQIVYFIDKLLAPDKDYVI